MSDSTERKYITVIPNISKFLEDDDLEHDFPLSNEMNSDKRYFEGEEIGRGGMKKILLTKDKLTSRNVALATLIRTEDPNQTENFFREAKLTAKLQHPCIVPVYDAGYTKEQQPFFTMKPVDGKNLQGYIQTLKSDADKNFQERVDIFSKICDAIAYAHAQNIIHLDLKPENIYLAACRA